ncbi:BTAD domain-containing putative transcriptional regulator [Streptomyces physcomitrii]|uniref:AAA family ATPase n=1 Tax=Streptomyces physcomitrii TaxID=2724184 RepID=A0ABX1GV58_9ACTN|nr:BTAD domain-containing putative transcriptional regulator [Streptomyces physcomitrii]NKI39956.1 AAA family ATPase [Streptomyces physcomitrii]
MEFRVLGPLAATAGGRSLPLGGFKQRAVLGLLLLRANRVVATSELLTALWPEEQRPATARKIVQNAVWGLRALLAGPAQGPAAAELLTQTPGYVLRVDPDRIDVHRFHRRVAEGRRRIGAGDFGEAARFLAQALGEWHGPALSDLAEEGIDWPELTALRQLRLDVLEDRFEAELRSGQHHSILGELVSLADEEPLRERLCGQLMLALYRCGRQAEALSVFSRVRQALVEEYGLEPSRELQLLQQNILTHDASLAPGVPPSPPAPASAGTSQPQGGGTSQAPAREERVNGTGRAAAQAGPPEDGPGGAGAEGALAGFRTAGAAAGFRAEAADSRAGGARAGFRAEGGPVGPRAESAPVDPRAEGAAVDPRAERAPVDLRTERAQAGFHDEGGPEGFRTGSAPADSRIGAAPADSRTEDLPAGSRTEDFLAGSRTEDFPADSRGEGAPTTGARAEGGASGTVAARTVAGQQGTGPRQETGPQSAARPGSLPGPSAALRDRPPTARGSVPAGAAAGEGARGPAAERRAVAVLLVRARAAAVPAKSPGEAAGPLSPHETVRAVASCVREFGGTMAGSVGHVCVALFGPDRAASSLDALRASLAVRERLAAFPGATCHLVVTAGDAVVRIDARHPARGASVSGRLVDQARALLTEVPQGEIHLCGEAARAALGPTRHTVLTHPVGRDGVLRLDGMYPLGGMPAPRRAEPSRHSFELTLLQSLLERSRRHAAPHLVTLLGDPGAGKTRFLVELAQSIAAEPLLVVRLGPTAPGARAGDSGAVLAPAPDGSSDYRLHEAVRRVAGRGETAERLLTRLRFPYGGTGARGGISRELVDAWCGSLLLLAREQPVVVFLDDAHGVPDAVLDSVERLAATARDVPLFLVVSARPELLERRPLWGCGLRHGVTLTLEPARGRGPDGELTLTARDPEVTRA